MKKQFLFLIVLFSIFLVSALVVTSLSNVYVESNDPEIGGQTWVATMVGGIGVQEIVGRIDSDDIESRDGRIAEHDLTIKETVNKNRCEYSFSEESKYIHKISLVPGMAGNEYFIWRVDWSGIHNQLDEKMAECRNTPNVYYMVNTDEGLKFKFYCWKKTIDAIKGNLIFDGYRTEITMSVSAGGITKTGTMNNYDKPSIEVGSGNTMAHFRWIGSSVSGERCETPAEQSITAMYKSASWKTIDENRYDDYRTYDQIGFGSCISNWLLGLGGSASGCTTNYNNKANSATLTKTFYSKSNTPAIVSGAKAIITLSRVIQFPQLVMRIKTAWLGIRIPIAGPQIISVSAEDFAVGEYGNIKVEVKNKDSNYAGDFAISVDCPNIFETIGSVPTVRLNPGETKTTNVLVKNIRDIEEKSCERCKVIVFNTEQTTTKDEDSIEVCVNILEICQEGETRCVNSEFEYCYKGVEWKRDSSKDSKCLIQECAKDGDCPRTKPFCVNDICAECKSNGDCPKEFPSCQSGACVKGTRFKWNNLYFLPILLTLGLAGYFGLRGKSKTGKYNYIDFIIGGVLGLAIGIGLYFLFTWWLWITLTAFFGTTISLVILFLIGGIPLILSLFSYLIKKVRRR